MFDFLVPRLAAFAVIIEALLLGILNETLSLGNKVGEFRQFCRPALVSLILAPLHVATDRSQRREAEPPVLDLFRAGLPN
jgi:hypothetical protein